MTTANKRFLKFLSFIEDYYELVSYPSLDCIIIYSVKALPKAILTFGVNKYIALKRSKYPNKFTYKDNSICVYQFSEDKFILKTDNAYLSAYFF